MRQSAARSCHRLRHQPRRTCRKLRRGGRQAYRRPARASRRVGGVRRMAAGAAAFLHLRLVHVRAPGCQRGAHVAFEVTQCAVTTLVAFLDDLETPAVGQHVAADQLFLQPLGELMGAGRAQEPRGLVQGQVGAAGQLVEGVEVTSGRRPGGRRRARPCWRSATWRTTRRSPYAATGCRTLNVRQPVCQSLDAEIGARGRGRARAWNPGPGNDRGSSQGRDRRGEVY